MTQVSATQRDSVAILFCMVISLVSWTAKGQGFKADSLYLGVNGYIEYFPGNMPLILAASHGGDLTPSGIPIRSCSGCVTVNDLNTQELARILRETFYKKIGCIPHLVINRLRRNRLDANRDIVEAALGNPEAEQAWHDYHGFLDSAKQIISKKYGRGLFIDLHGHGHSLQRLELGYLISGSTLRLTDASLNGPSITLNSSIRKLAADNRKNLSHAELLRGAFSLGELLEKSGYPAVPSASDPAPKSGQEYFSGGYSTERHGSVEGGSIDAIQIECNFQGIRDSEISLQFFANALTNSLLEYLEQHYFNILPSCQSTTAVVQKNPQQSYKLYSNPGCGEFTLLDGENSSFSGELHIHDTMGKELGIQDLSAGKINLPGGKFPNGLYWLIAEQNDGKLIRIPLLQQCSGK